MYLHGFVDHPVYVFFFNPSVTIEPIPVCHFSELYKLFWSLLLVLVLDPFDTHRSSTLYLLSSCLGLVESCWSCCLDLRHLLARVTIVMPYLRHEFLIIFLAETSWTPLISPAWRLASHACIFCSCIIRKNWSWFQEEEEKKRNELEQ